MSLIAAFLWNKSPRPSISTLIVNDENVKLLSNPTIIYFNKSYLKFRNDAKKTIKAFFLQLKDFYQRYKKPIIIEFRIVFDASHLDFYSPSLESKFVYKNFIHFSKQIKKELKLVKIKPQLRKRLSGKPLKQFKNELRSLYLVERKRNSGFQYQLWAVALHATPATYAATLHKIRTQLKRQAWEGEN